MLNAGPYCTNIEIESFREGQNVPGVYVMREVNQGRCLSQMGPILLVATLQGGASTAEAQGDVRQSAPLLQRAHTDEYLLGPGDELKISVVDLEEYKEKTVKIDPDGQIDLPLIGELQAAGEGLNDFVRKCVAGFRVLSRTLRSR